MRATKSLLVCMSMILLIVATTDIFVIGQPNQFNITNIEPNTLYPGTVFAVNGGQFIEGSSQIYFGQSTGLETYFESENRLVAIVPLVSRFCGEQGIIVKTEVNINNSLAQIDSNFVVKDIQCQNPNNLMPATPTISNVTQLDLISGEAAIRIEGRNLIPSDNTGYTFYDRYTTGGPYPYTQVRVYNSDYEYIGRGQYQSFGQMRFNLPEDVYCGEYQVELTNYFSESQVSNYNVPSSVSLVQINEYCQGGNVIPPENGEIPGGYEVMNLELPSTAYVNEQINGSVQVQYIGSYFPDNVMGLYVNGELRDTQELDMDPDETSTYPLSFNFDRPGSYEIEIRVGDSYQSQTIDVQSENGTGPPPPTQGGNTLADYDMDGDCVMSDTEFFVATDAWISESISDLLFFSAVDAWIGQSNICTTAASASVIELSLTPQGMLISTTTGAALGAVAIYDANGRLVFRSSAPNPKLFWNLRDVVNHPVANGVYFVRVGNSGEVYKFVVMK